MATDVNTTQLDVLKKAITTGDLIAGVMPLVADILQGSIDKNFREGGRFGSDNEYGGGSQKWQQSQRAKEQGGLTGVDTGRGRTSVQVLPAGGSSVILSSGGVNYMTFFHYGTKHQVPRPVMVIQDEDLDEIEATVSEYVEQRLGAILK